MSKDFSQASTHKEKVRPSSAVSRWSMDSKDVSSGSIQDSWGSNDGPLNGGVTTGASGVGGGEAFNFDGSDDYVSVPKIDTSDVTISAWCYFSESSGSNWNEGTMNGLLCFSGTDGQTYEEAVIFNSHSIRFFWNSGDDTARLSEDFDEQLNQWMHLALTVEGNKTVFYKNGVKIASKQHSALQDWNLNIHQNQYFGRFDGTNNVQRTNNYQKGKIDEVRIYSEALSQQQIWKLYNIGRNANWGLSRS